VAGEPLQLRPSARRGIFQLYYRGVIVGQLSKIFHQKLAEYLIQGYRIKEVKVDFVVHWRDKDRERELRHVLGKIELTKEG